MNGPAVRAVDKPQQFGRVYAPTEWRMPLTIITLAGLGYEILTGLLVYLAPFSVFNQYSVLFHTLIGLVWVPVFAWYLGRHWWLRFRGNFNHVQLLGYVASSLILVCIVSGVVLTWQALFGTRIHPTWDFVHIVSGVGLTFVVPAHLLIVWVREGNATAAVVPLRAAKRAFLVRVGTVSVFLLAVHGASALFYTEPPAGTEFPADYSWRYGADRPFAPSLARVEMADVESTFKSRILSVLTPAQGAEFFDNLKPDPTKHVGFITVAERLSDQLPLEPYQRDQIRSAADQARDRFKKEGAIHPRQLAGSAGCGTSGCHSEIVEEWLPSAHRYASMDFVFQEVQTNMAKDLAPEATRYCAGCHDPIAMFSGAKNVGNLTLSAEGADEGVSCLSCHSIVQTDVRGNADYTVQVPKRYLFELHDGALAKGISDFLIRAYPRQHLDSYSRPLYKTAEACGACHKQFVDEEVNDFGWVQGQNQYDSWRKSRWHVEADESKTISCRECHMPLMASRDPAAGDPHDRNRTPQDGKHRSHRFLGANQYIPRYLKLQGWEKQTELTEQWLRGEYPVPEIADRWTTGPVIRLGLNVPEDVRPGEEVNIQVIVNNNKAGHDFPTGPMDMIEGWVEVTVTDAAGNMVFASARPDERDYLVNPQIVFKAELINRFGELIGRHELWQLVGARFKRTLFPGVTDSTTFAFECPGMPADPARQAELPTKDEHPFRVPADIAGNELHVSAVVWYCKFSAPFLDRLFGEDTKMRSEVTEVARAEAVIRIAHHEVASTE